MTSTKLRPALVIAAHGEDFIVLGIFSRVPTGTPRKTWILLAPENPSFVQTGLAKASVLKAEKIAIVHHSVLQRKLGKISADLIMQVEQALRSALHLT